MMDGWDHFGPNCSKLKITGRKDWYAIQRVVT